MFGHHHNHNRNGFGYSNYQAPFASDMDRDGLVTERDFIINARERGWGYAGGLKKNLNIFNKSFFNVYFYFSR